MSSQKFHYKYIEIDGTYRPIIPISIKYNNEDLQYVALIDSGADECIFHLEMANVLGIDLSNCKTKMYYGISGNTKGYIAKVKLGLMDKGKLVYGYLDTEVAFANLNDNAYGIFGQRGFFEHFIVKMDYRKKDIEFKSN